MKIYRKIYEEHYGSIPKGYHIHHIDFNHNNNDPSNLEALTPEEHGKKHERHIPNQTGKTWKWSEKSKDRWSKTRQGMEFSKEHINNLSKAHKGKPWSEARRKAQENRV